MSRRHGFSPCRTSSGLTWPALVYNRIMPRKIDIAGQRFGRLIAKVDTGTSRSGRLWLCLCDCGAEAIVTTHDLRSGHTASCGCFRADTAGAINFTDLTGETFGRLYVIGRTEANQRGPVTWACRCSCGNEIDVIGAYMTSGDTQSCGCLRSDIVAAANRKRSLPSEERAAREQLRGKVKYLRNSSDPAWMLAERVRTSLRRTLRKVDATKDARTFKMLGFTPQEFAAHMERQFVRGMSWENMGRWHIDHIVPICEAKSKSDVLRLNQLSNLRPLWGADNLAKCDAREFLL